MKTENSSDPTFGSPELGLSLQQPEDDGRLISKKKKDEVRPPISFSRLSEQRPGILPANCRS
jgi:hypothetical protein